MSTPTLHSMPIIRVLLGNNTGCRDGQPILQLKELTVDAARYKAWKQWVDAQRAQEKRATAMRERLERQRAGWRRVSLTPSERQLDSAK